MDKYLQNYLQKHLLKNIRFLEQWMPTMDMKIFIILEILLYIAT